MMNRKMLLALLLALSLAACGGSDGGDSNTGNDDDDDGDNTPDTMTGVFVDSEVAGIAYSTATQEGETNAQGEFEYVSGEEVVFSIGDIELPGVTGGEIITVLDLFDTDDATDPRVINLARLLQSLDEDGDPDNGITLTDAAHTAATGLELDFDVPVDTFEANTDVINLVSNGGGAGTLVSADDALAHLQELSIVGSWYITNDDDTMVVTFMRDGTYMYAEGTEALPEDPGGFPGVEYGTYTWDPLTKVITADVEVDTTGLWGLSELTGNETVERDGSSLAYANPDTPDDNYAFALASSEASLVGAWELKIPEEEVVIVLTFTETHYAHAEIAPEDEVGSSGPEFGTYSWDSETGAFNPVSLINLNGEWGFSDEPAAITLMVDGDTLTATFEGEEGATTLTRVK